MISQTFPTSLANIYPVILLSISSILANLGYSSSSKNVQQICVSAPLCVNSMVPLSSPIEILCFLQLPVQVLSLVIVLVQYCYKKWTFLVQRTNLLNKNTELTHRTFGHQKQPGLTWNWMESEVPENRRWKLFFPSLGPQVSICLLFSSRLLHYSHSCYASSLYFWGPMAYLSHQFQSPMETEYILILSQFPNPLEREAYRSSWAGGLTALGLMSTL